MEGFSEGLAGGVEPFEAGDFLPEEGAGSAARAPCIPKHQSQRKQTRKRPTLHFCGRIIFSFIPSAKNVVESCITLCKFMLISFPDSKIITFVHSFSPDKGQAIIPIKPVLNVHAACSHKG